MGKLTPPRELGSWRSKLDFERFSQNYELTHHIQSQIALLELEMRKYCAINVQFNVSVDSQFAYPRKLLLPGSLQSTIPRHLLTQTTAGCFLERCRGMGNYTAVTCRSALAYNCRSNSKKRKYFTAA